MDKTAVIHKHSAGSRHFFSISRIPSPQRLQNLVDYHPIFCPNAGDCSFFVLFVNEGDIALMGFLHLAGHEWPAAVQNSEYTWRFSWLSLPTNVR
ncbi:TPA: hypothetical protein ACN7C3_001766 [Klebsiella pneumoniae]|nr:hypothetical protein [Klebsiella pneumoniae]